MFAAFIVVGEFDIASFLSTQKTFIVLVITIRRLILGNLFFCDYFYLKPVKIIFFSHRNPVLGTVMQKNRFDLRLRRLVMSGTMRHFPLNCFNISVRHANLINQLIPHYVRMFLAPCMTLFWWATKSQFPTQHSFFYFHP